MYVPKRFENNDFSESMELMRKFPFATVITVKEGRPFVSHLPLVVENHALDDQLSLVGHLARANPHSKILHEANTYVIFNGPHAYITPLWYAENNVPTWNYAVVHLQGTCELIEDTPGIVSCLEKLTAHMEAGKNPKWDFWIPDDLQEDALAKHIVGFKIHVNSIQSKFKLSQNRSAQDRQGVTIGLGTKGDDMSLAILDLMKRRG